MIARSEILRQIWVSRVCRSARQLSGMLEDCCVVVVRAMEIRRDQPNQQRQEEAEVQSVGRFNSSNTVVGYYQNVLFSSCTTRARSALE